ncbi:MAG: hypothetical protein J6X60_12025, partial [Ruminiclostridium sp.]|nr:hypothetical protein [Ruminiclostridium sp.]
IPPQLAAFGIMMLIIGSSEPTEPIGVNVYGEPVNFRRFLCDSAFFIILGSAMMYSFSVMMISLCGRRLTAVTLPYLYSLLLTLSSYFLTTLVRSHAYGITTEEFYTSSDVAFGAEITPIGYIFSTLGWSGGNIRNIITAFVCIAVFTVGSYYLIRYRRSERIGKAFVYKGAHRLTQFLVILTAVSIPAMRIFTGDDIELVSYSELMFSLLRVSVPMLLFIVLVLSAVFWFIIEIICRERLGNPKILGLSVIRFICFWALSVLLCFVLNSEWLVDVERIPEISEVESVRYYGYIANTLNYTGTVTSEEDIQRLEEFHRTILDERPDSRKRRDTYWRWTDGDYAQVHFVYTLKNGDHIAREYHLTGEYIRPAAELIFSTAVFGSQYELPEEITAEDLSIVYHTYDVDSGISERIGADIPKEEFEKAVKLDAANTTFDDVFRLPNRTEYINTENSIVSTGYPIYSFFGNTRSLLEKYWLDIFPEMHADRYFITKVTGLGGGTMGFLPETAEYRELTPEQFSALCPCDTAEKTLYDDARDIYIITLADEVNDDGTGSKGLANFHGLYFVTEDNCGRAAEIFDSAAELSKEFISENRGLLSIG